MPLTGKYLKYSPEITLEIFTLVWNKLINLGWIDEDNTLLNKAFLYFSTTHNYFKGRYKKVFNQSRVKDGVETTIQEILGYDPFVKDDFVLPEKWCVKASNKEEDDILVKWRNGTHCDEIGKSYMLYEKYWSPIKGDCDEITFEQFKKYVLKQNAEEDKKVIPEYIECIKDIYGLKIGKVYHVINNIIMDGRYNNYSIINNNKIKPSTKEAFDAQNKPKKLLSLNNWYQSGNHVVYLYERNKVYGFHHDKWFTSDGFNENDLKYIDSYSVEQKFTEYIKNNYLIGQPFVDLVNKIDFQVKNYDLNFSNNTTQIYIPVEPNDLKGNKTARIFDKGVWAEYSSIKSTKQAIHCITQEEWDFVNSKMKFTSRFGTNACVRYLDDGCTSSIKYFKERHTNNYQLLSFQEWCDLNSYKMDNQFKFEVDKWYSIKTAFSWIIKFKEKRKGIIIASWYCEDKLNEKVQEGGNWGTNPTEIKELSIEEIQQYLPDNHPDKILEFSKENNFNPYNFKVGDYLYVLKEGYKGDILEIIRIKPEYDFNASWIHHKNYSFSGGGFRFSKTCHPYGVDIRLATKEEIQNYKDREAFNSYNLADIKLNKILNSKINLCQAIERLDRSNTSIFPTFEEKPSIKITEFEINKDYFIDFKDPYN